MNFLLRFCRDESGANLIEYGLLIALVVVGLIASISTIGQTFVASPINTVANSMGSAR